MRCAPIAATKSPLVLRPSLCHEGEGAMSREPSVYRMELYLQQYG